MFSYTACPDSSGKSRNVGKTLLKTLFFFLLLTQICFGQWYTQNSGTAQHLYAVQFVDANKGWAVGDSGTIIHTTNAGATWLQQNSGTHHPLFDVSFINSNKGWAVGYSGDWSNPDSAIIINTTDGGLNWNTQFSILGKFYEVCFTSEYIGYVFGNTANYDASIIVKTTDGGSTWSYVYQPAYHGRFGCFFNDNIGWRVYYGLRGNSPHSAIHKTTDGGLSWAVQDTLGGIWVSKLKSFDGNFCVAVGGMIEKPRGYIAKTYNGGSDWILECLWTPGPLGIKELRNVSISSIDVITMIED